MIAAGQLITIQMASSSRIPLQGNGAQLSSVLHNGMIAHNGAKKFEHRQHKKIFFLLKAEYTRQPFAEVLICRNEAKSVASL